MHNSWTNFFIFLLGDPHLLEGTQRCQDGSADPPTVRSLRRYNNPFPCVTWNHGCKLPTHTVSKAREQGATATEINTAKYRSTHTQEGWLEEGLGAAEMLIAVDDHLNFGSSGHSPYSQDLCFYNCLLLFFCSLHSTKHSSVGVTYRNIHHTSDIA